MKNIFNTQSLFETKQRLIAYGKSIEQSKAQNETCDFGLLAFTFYTPNN